ncbi:MAG: prepilin-type N-terminal cleavage/methylation domain-containing protein, partial [Eubacterium sp.]|nr:prepilin-type N-terminal cleavage/methylation domain-containing protein [Eubacterium sp.]
MVDKDINRIVCAKSSKRNFEKGFTLVELIVVLVVMAVLAAAVVPALLGYTDHAKKKKYIETAKQCLDASQAVLSDRYNDPSITLTKEQRYSAASSADVDPTKTRFTVWTAKKLIDYDTLSMTSAVSDNLAAYTITYALFETTLNDDEDNDAKYVFYDGKDWEVYDTEDDVKSELSIHHLTKDNTSNVVFMWPRETDKIVVANHPEEWKEESGEPIDKTVTFHLTHLGYEHGVVFKVDDEIVDKDEIQIKFTRNETSNPESGQCTSMMDGSVVTDEYGNEYQIALEDGFRDLKWSTTP